MRSKWAQEVEMVYCFAPLLALKRDGNRAWHPYGVSSLLDNLGVRTVCLHMSIYVKRVATVLSSGKR